MVRAASGVGLLFGADFVAAHGHGVDGGVELFDGEGCGGAEFFAAVFAEEEYGERAGGDVEAVAEGELFLWGDGGGVEVVEGVGAGVAEDGEEDQIALGEVGRVVGEDGELFLEEGVLFGRGEEEEDAVFVDEGGDSLGVDEWGHEESEQEEAFHGVFFFVGRLGLSFFWMRSFHAVWRAPVREVSSAAARRIWVAPMRPQPPGMGRKRSGASATKSACWAGVSIRLP